MRSFPLVSWKRTRWIVCTFVVGLLLGPALLASAGEIRKGGSSVGSVESNGDIRIGHGDTIGAPRGNRSNCGAFRAAGHATDAPPAVRLLGRGGTGRARFPRARQSCRIGQTTLNPMLDSVRYLLVANYRWESP